MKNTENEKVNANTKLAKELAKFDDKFDDISTNEIDSKDASSKTEEIVDVEAADVEVANVEMNSSKAKRFCSITFDNITEELQALKLDSIVAHAIFYCKSIKVNADFHFDLVSFVESLTLAVKNRIIHVQDSELRDLAKQHMLHSSDLYVYKVREQLDSKRTTSKETVKAKLLNKAETDMSIEEIQAMQDRLNAIIATKRQQDKLNEV